MIEYSDLERLMSEFAAVIEDDSPEAWCEENDFEPEAIGEFITGQVAAMFSAVMRREVDLVTAPTMLSLTGFILGWEAHKQLGRRE